MPIATISPQNNSQQALLAQSLSGTGSSLMSALNSAIQKSRDDAQLQFNQQKNLLNEQQRNIANERAERFDLRDRAQFVMEFGQKQDRENLTNQGRDIANQSSQFSLDTARSDRGLSEALGVTAPQLASNQEGRLGRQEGRLDSQEQRAMSMEARKVEADKRDTMFDQSKIESSRLQNKGRELSNKASELKLGALEDNLETQEEQRALLERDRSLNTKDANSLVGDGIYTDIDKVASSNPAQLIADMKTIQASDLAGTPEGIQRVSEIQTALSRAQSLKKSALRELTPTQRSKFLSDASKLRTQMLKLKEEGSSPEQLKEIENEAKRLETIGKSGFIEINKSQPAPELPQKGSPTEAKQSFLKTGTNTKKIQITPPTIEEFGALKRKAITGEISNPNDRLDALVGISGGENPKSMGKNFVRASKFLKEAYNRVIDPKASAGGFFGDFTGDVMTEKERDDVMKAAATRAYLSQFPNTRTKRAITPLDSDGNQGGAKDSQNPLRGGKTTEWGIPDKKTIVATQNHSGIFYDSDRSKVEEIYKVLKEMTDSVKSEKSSEAQSKLELENALKSL